jgi:hypothetical protein
MRIKGELLATVLGISIVLYKDPWGQVFSIGDPAMIISFLAL